MRPQFGCQTLLHVRDSIDLKGLVIMTEQIQLGKIESLEGRRMLAVWPYAGFAYTNTNSDTISFYKDGSGHYHVDWTDGTNSDPHDYGSISTMNFDLNNGHDRLTIQSSVASTINVTITGGGGNDTIYTGASEDDVDGGSSDDTIVASDGEDTVSGGGGNDYYSGGLLSSRRYEVTLDGTTNDKLWNSTLTDVISTQNINVEYFDGTVLADTITGSSSDNILWGSDGADSLLGVGGNDTIFGEVGNDTIDGGSGNDSVNGGSSNDTMYGQGGVDFFFSDDGNADYLDGGSDSDTADRDGFDTTTAIETLL